MSGIRWRIEFAPHGDRADIPPIDVGLPDMARQIRDHVRTTLGRDDVAIAVYNPGSSGGYLVLDGYIYGGLLTMRAVQAEPEQPLRGVRASGGGA